MSYYIKPIGSTEDPLTPKQKFGKEFHTIHFSRTKGNNKYPPDICKGDTLICYGVGDGRLVSVFKVSDFPKITTRESIDTDLWEANDENMHRWPWYVMAENMTPSYGKNWALHQLYLKDCISSFTGQIEKNIIGCIQLGHSFISIKRDFALYLINKIESNVY
jgi:hypothetical protein